MFRRGATKVVPFFLGKDSKELNEIIAGCYKKPVKGLTGKYVGKI